VASEIFCFVYLIIKDRKASLTATDGYIQAWADTTITGDDIPAEATILALPVNWLKATAKSKGDFVSFRLCAENDRWVAESASGGKITLEKGTPEVFNLLTKTSYSQGEPAQQFAIDPNLFMRAAKAIDADATIVTQVYLGMPMALRAEHGHALVMPMLIQKQDYEPKGFGS
jgi:hypothetical protein